MAYDPNAEGGGLASFSHYNVITHVEGLTPVILTVTVV